MKTRSRILATAASATILGAGLVGGSSAGAAQLASANGQGTLDSGQRHFSFSARQSADGTVKGQATLTNSSFTGENGHSPYKLQIDISCMNQIGNTVFFGGTTRRTNDPNLVDAVFFSVQDNGEPGKGVDMISRAYFWDDDPSTIGNPQACQDNAVGDFPMEPIEAGNIQVK